MSLRFDITARDTDSAARTGLVHVARGVIETPVFMPVGTQASVKSLDSNELRTIGATIILGNTYHLYLRPGTEVLEQFGGIHRFMQWDRPVLTDSGGFQIFSLSALNKVTEEGVMFRSSLDGSRHFFTPEKAVDIQRSIGSDIIMCLDECTEYPASLDRAAASMALTERWARRCKAHWEQSGGTHQSLFAIVQGNVYESLRKNSAEALAALDFPLRHRRCERGESKEEMELAVAWSTAVLPEGNHATLWAWAHPKTCSPLLPTGSICLTAYYPRATPGTETCLPVRDGSISRTPGSRGTPDP